MSQMTPENRGGMRPTAPQNNPSNVSATGGNGQMANATQAAQYIPGLPQGQGQATYDMQVAAPLAGNPTAPAFSQQPNALVGLFDTAPVDGVPQTSGLPVGAGPGREALTPASNMVKETDPSVQIIRALYMNDPHNQDLRAIVETLDQQGRLV